MFEQNLASGFNCGQWHNGWTGRRQYLLYICMESASVALENDSLWKWSTLSIICHFNCKLTLQSNV